MINSKQKRNVTTFGLIYFSQKLLSLFYTIVLLRISAEFPATSEIDIFLLLPSILGFLTIFDFGFGNFLVADKSLTRISETLNKGFICATFFIAMTLIIYGYFTTSSYYNFVLTIFLNYLNYAYTILFGFFLKNKKIHFSYICLLGQLFVPMIALLGLYIGINISHIISVIITTQFVILIGLLSNLHIARNLTIYWIQKGETYNYSLIQICTFIFTGADIFILIAANEEEKREYLEIFRIIAIMLALPNIINLFDTLNSHIYKPNLAIKILLSVAFAFVLSNITLFKIPTDYLIYTFFLICASYIQTDFLITKLRRLPKIIPIFVIAALAKALFIWHFGILGSVSVGVLMIIFLFRQKIDSV